MPLCNLIEYSSNYSKTRESLWFHFKDELTLMQILLIPAILNLSSISLNY